MLGILAVTCGALGVFMALCARLKRMRSKLRWGRHGRGYPISEFGAWSWSLYFTSFGLTFALQLTQVRWLKIGSWMFFGLCFLEMIYAFLHDRAAHRRH